MNKGEEYAYLKQEQAFNEFQNLTRTNDILEPKTTIMLHLAAAMAVGCYP